MTGKVGSAIAEGRVGDAVGAVKEEASKTVKTDNGKDTSQTHERYPKRGPEELKPATAPPKMSSMSIARGIVKQEGWKGLWRGGALRGGWTMLGSGLYLGVYESGRAWLERNRANAEATAN